MAKQVIKDLITGDGAKYELKEVYKLVDMKDQQINLYKQKDSLKDSKIDNLQLIITKKDDQLSLEREKSNSLLSELKTQKLKTAFYKTSTGAAILTTIYLLLKK